MSGAPPDIDPGSGGTPAPILTPAQCRAARALLWWSQAELAARSAVSSVTIRNFERGRSSLRDATARLLRLTLERAGVALIDAVGVDGAGIAERPEGREPSGPGARLTGAETFRT
ncbi:helix-turn-helix domain-containing protein [Pelagibius sp.]|uniref:helix-turn-helix domain-containing protein n=1 Tax=Pelagibius sp. TaxID=1931238 RepID=UPI003B5057F0